MSLTFVTNCFNKITSYLPQIPPITKDSLKIFDEWCPDRQNIKRIVLISSLASTAFYFVNEATCKNELVYKTSVLCVLGGAIYSLKKNDPFYMNTSLLVSNFTGLFFKTVNPLFCILAYYFVDTIYARGQQATVLPKKEQPWLPREEPTPSMLNFLPSTFKQPKLTMTGMKAALDEYIVGQDAAKQTIIEAIFFHQHSHGKGDQTKLCKGNVLLIGPSGSGKTFIVETIARYLQIPVGTLDLSRVTREGYIGPKISEVFISLLDSANGDIEKASRGIVFFDETDKIFEDAMMGKNEITGFSIQNQLLCMLQGDTIRVGEDKYGQGGTFLKTQDILFIFAGAFHKQTIASEGKQLDDEQLIAGGVRPEFLGRIGYISQLTALTGDQIKKILTHGPNAVLTHWKKNFEDFGFALILKEETLDKIVTNAMSKQTGARGLHYELRSMLSKLLGSLIIEQEKSKTSPIPGKLKQVEV